MFILPEGDKTYASDMHGDLIKTGYVKGHYTFWPNIATEF